jgi:hypothetical protein
MIELYWSRDAILNSEFSISPRTHEAHTYTNNAVAFGESEITCADQRECILLFHRAMRAETQFLTALTAAVYVSEKCIRTAAN